MIEWIWVRTIRPCGDRAEVYISKDHKLMQTRWADGTIETYKAEA